MPAQRAKPAPKTQRWLTRLGLDDKLGQVSGLDRVWVQRHVGHLRTKLAASITDASELASMNRRCMRFCHGRPMAEAGEGEAWLQRGVP